MTALRDDRGYPKDDRNSNAYKFLEETRCIVKPQEPSGARSITHTLIGGMGGKFSVPDSLTKAFLAAHLKDVRAGSAMSISELRSVFVHPMYVDCDFKGLPCKMFPKEAAVRIAAVMTEQLRRFYPADCDRECFDCVVCIKGDPLTSEAYPGLQDAQGTYKHGVHLHWPKLIVSQDATVQYMRPSIVAGLERHDLEWRQRFQLTDRVPWESVVDEAVYSSGLRLLGSPKNEKRGNGKDAAWFVSENSTYCMLALVADGQVDEERTQLLRTRPLAMVAATSVRASDGVEAVKGFAPYEGCPAPPRAGKRKCGGGGEPVSARMRSQGTEVTSPSIVSVIKQIIVGNFGSKYKDVALRITATPEEYFINLRGDGANFCPNINGFHKSRTVYITIAERGRDKKIFPVLKCYCRCPSRPGMDKECRKFRLDGTELRQEHINLLFKKKSKDPMDLLSNIGDEIAALTNTA